MIRKQQLLTGRPEKQMGFFARLGRDVKRNYILYIMIAPVVAYYVIFCYWPMLYSSSHRAPRKKVAACMT